MVVLCSDSINIARAKFSESANFIIKPDFAMKNRFAVYLKTRHELGIYVHLETNNTIIDEQASF